MIAFHPEIVQETGNPFLGLRPFQPEHAHLYFGREDHVKDLRKRLEQDRFVAVVGDSGVGKSSLVAAGLVPELVRGAIAARHRRWTIITFRPGMAPLHNLARSLALSGGGGEHDPDGSTSRIESALQLSSRALADTLSRLDLSRNTNVLLFADQFEEIFAFLDEKHSSRARQEAVLYVRQLLETASFPGEPFYFLLTMRSEYLGRCVEFTGLPEALNGGQYLVPQLTRDQLREAVVGPMAVRDTPIAEALVQKLLNEAAEGANVLSVLQHALMRTWLRAEQRSARTGEPLELRLEDYHSAAGVSAALDQHANEVLASLQNEKQRALTRLVFQAITHKDPAGRTRRRRTPVRTLVRITGASLEEIRTVVQVFAHQDSGILSLQPESSFDQETIVDLTHESVMAKWRMLASWIDEEDRDYGLFRDALVDAKRCREGEDTLWRGVRVNEAVKWADQPHHNAAWAERYVGRPHEAPKSVKAVRDFIRRSVRLQEREDGLLRRKRRNASIAFALACGLLVLAIVFLVDRSRKNEQLNAQSKKLGATVVTLSKKEGELQDAIARQKMTLADLGLAKETAEENLQRAKENATRRAEAERELEHLLEKQFSTNRRLERTQAQLEQQVKDLDTAKKEINGLLDKSTEQFKKLQEEQKESNRLRAESEQLRRESDRGAALSRALAGNTNLARGEALLSLNDAIVSLELGIRAEWVPPETVQLTRRALQAVNTLALFRPANTEIADIAVISDGRLRALSNNGRLRQGALGCSVGSNRYNGLPIVYLGRFASSRLAEAYLKKPSAQALDSGGGVLLGFADGSARWLLADSRSSTQEPDPARDAGGDISFEDIKDWRPHKGKIALIAASRDLGGVLTATAGDEPAVMISRSQGRQRSLLSLINILRRPQKAAELISEPTGLAMTRDGAEIALIQREGSLLWGSAVGGKWALKPLLYKDPSAVAIAGRPDEPQIAVGTKAGVVWTGTNPNSLNMVRPLGEPVSALAWNESGTLLAVGGEKGALEIFDSGRPRQVAGHSGAVKRLVWASVADQDVLISSDVTSIRLTNAREVPGVRELASRLPRAGPINAKAQEEARKVAEGLKEVLRIRLDQDANCLPAHLKSLRQSLTAKTP